MSRRAVAGRAGQPASRADSLTHPAPPNPQHRVEMAPAGRWHPFGGPLRTGGAAARRHSSSGGRRGGLLTLQAAAAVPARRLPRRLVLGGALLGLLCGSRLRQLCAQPAGPRRQRARGAAPTRLHRHARISSGRPCQLYSQPGPSPGAASSQPGRPVCCHLHW